MASADSKFDDVNAFIARELSGFTYTHSLTMNSKFSILYSVVRYLNFSFIASELVKVNPDNSSLIYGNL